MMLRTKILLCLTILISAQIQADQYSRFWDWFQNNQSTYYAMNFDDHDQIEDLFDELAAQLVSIDDNLTFEFGKLPNGTMDFVISAGGITSSFPNVINIVSKAPKIENWRVTSFRQPKNINYIIEMEGIELDPSSVQFQLYRDGEKIGVVLHIPNYEKTANKIYEQLGFLLLDQTLGEYSVGTKLGFVDFEKLAGDVESSFLVEDIRSVFERN